MNDQLRYSMVIQWSDEGRVYIVSLPEWGDFVHTHGDTYEEVFHRGKELIDALTISRRDRGEPLPEPRVFAVT